MDRYKLIAANGLSEYFDILSKIGYKCDWGTNQLLALLLVEDLLNSKLSIFIGEEDLRYIETFRNCLIGSTCLLPFNVACNDCGSTIKPLPPTISDSYVMWSPSAGVLETIYITPEDTPLENFCRTSGGSAPVIINNQNLDRLTIRKIYFGKEYDSFTSLPDYFCSYLTNLENLKLPNNIVTIGNYFLNTVYGFKQRIELPSTVKNIGTNFFRYSASYDGRETIPSQIESIGLNFFYSTDFLTRLYIKGFDASQEGIISTDAFFGIPNDSYFSCQGTASDINKFRNKFTQCNQWTGSQISS